MAPDRGVKRKERKERKASVLQPKALMMKTKPKKGVETQQQASVRKQIRNLQRLLKRDLSQEVRQAQEKRLKDLQSQTSSGSRLIHDRAMSAKYKQVRFFERRKVERRIRRAEKELRNAPNEDSKKEAADKLRQLRQDLQYIRFFPKAEKYVSLFMNNADKEALARREKLRESIAANVAAAAAAGIDLEETGSEEEDFTLDMTQDDDFFLQAGSDDEDGTSAEFKDASVTTNSSKPTKQQQIGAKNNNNNSTTKKRSQNQIQKKQTHKQEKRNRPSLGASSNLTSIKQGERQWQHQNHPGAIGQSQQQQDNHENANHAEKEKRKRKRKRPSKKK